MYKCGWNGCEKAYGTLNHLNAHVTMQSHGAKRTPEGKSCSVFRACHDQDLAWAATHLFIRTIAVTPKSPFAFGFNSLQSKSFWRENCCVRPLVWVGGKEAKLALHTIA
jgi:hypothetical protein